MNPAEDNCVRQDPTAATVRIERDELIDQRSLNYEVERKLVLAERYSPKNRLGRLHFKCPKKK